MASTIVSECFKALIARHLTIAFVESATAGKMSYEFSTVPESGRILIGGMVCYNSCMKEDALGVPHALIERFTAESAEVTQAMARQFCKTVQSDVCIALTGLTTPGGSETPQKPVGTIFVHAIISGREIAKRFEFDGPAESVVNQAIDATAALILTAIH